MDSLFVRYSNALLSLAKQENKVKEYKEAIKSLLEFFANNEEINVYLKSYFMTEDEKYKVVETLCKQYNLKNLTSFMKLLVKKHRFNDFKYIAKEFINGSNESLGISEGFVYSVEPLNKLQIEKIENAISKRLNGKVELTNKIDKRLIGGIKVVIHDYVFDGSLSYKIETMKNNLNERRSKHEN
ncbi:MAG: F0F1 ATP synthase subunit delta [Bacilli bacterium]|nr:F0F1 ATP synthase subunit delta [Bacilli bacterium]